MTTNQVLFIIIAAIVIVLAVVGFTTVEFDPRFR